ncbi:MAG: DUF4394 domain-containing protein, partial [Bacteroidota bacterium]|nr:DUF4394 domain-containing protein [Bacteroidota bacterium]
FTRCAKDENAMPANNVQIDTRGPGGTLVPLSATLYGLTQDNELVKITTSPFTVGTPVPIEVKGSRDVVYMLAIDFRPATKRLYSVGNDNLIYTIDPLTGSAQAVSGFPFSPVITGTMVGFDFNPADDRIRLVTDTDQNLRIHPGSGQVVGVDAAIRPTQLSVNSIAYSTGTTGLSGGGGTLFDIDATTSSLYKQNGNLGTLALIGTLGVNVLSEAGFDIGRKGDAWVTFFGGVTSSGGPGDVGTLPNDNYLFSVNLGTGKVRMTGRVPKLTGLAVQ